MQMWSQLQALDLGTQWIGVQVRSTAGLMKNPFLRWKSNINEIVKKEYSACGEFKKITFMVCIAQNLRLTIPLRTKKSENYSILSYRVRKILTLDKLRKHSDNDQLSPVLEIVSQ
jgi:hypothetical protein